MRYYNYLNENRSQSITKEKFDELLNKNCSQFLDKMNKDSSVKIYRGLDSSFEYCYIDPTKFNRKSANTSNYYTILFDEILPSWKPYPLRSKSIICSSVMIGAAGYGDVFLVYPYNGSKIGVCSEDDLWYSFSNSFTFDLNALNRSLEYIDDLMSFGLKENRDSLLKFCKAIDNSKYIYDNVIKSGDSIVIELMEGYKKSKSKFIDYLDRLLNPDKNGFNNYTTSNYKQHFNKEVFIEGPCLMRWWD